MTDEFHQCKFAYNQWVKETPGWTGKKFSFLNNNDALEFHRSLLGYAATPLKKLPETAKELGLCEIYVKDESHRFGIKAFKAIGASYAIYRVIKQRWQERFQGHFTPGSFKDPRTLEQLGSITFCAATDGNHGRAVAWTAKKLKQRAVIYMPDNTAQSRIDNIKSDNGEVVLVPGTFDDCVKRCAHDADKNEWQAISDTAYEGYMEIPGFILLGYTTMFREMEGSIHLADQPVVDNVFLPAGVGGLAAAGTSYYVKRYGAQRPMLFCVEPSDCDCFLESVRFGSGNALPTRGGHDSIMAGLNCGTPSPVAWPVIRDGMHWFMGITDNYVEEAMREYADEGIISGESGASGLAALMAIFKDKKLKELKDKCGLNESSRVLLINTEGDTDPINYRKIVGL